MFFNGLPAASATPVRYTECSIMQATLDAITEDLHAHQTAAISCPGWKRG